MKHLIACAALIFAVLVLFPAPSAHASVARGASRLPHHQRDPQYWQAELQSVLSDQDPILKNLRITRLHYLLSTALRRVIGPDAGANFHSFAVWGSTQAGLTIRAQDFRVALENEAFRSLPGGARTGRFIAWLSGDKAGRAPAGPLAAPLGLLLGRPLIKRLATTTRTRITPVLVAANELVVRLTAQHTIRFLMAFHDLQAPDAGRLAAFLTPFRRGTLAQGGDDQLRQAYRCYYEARFATDLDQRREATHEGVVRMMLQEMTRMQPYFRSALPRGLARGMMRFFSIFRVGDLRFDMRRDVRRLPISPELAQIDDAELRAFVDGVLRRGGVGRGGRGSGISELDSRDDRLGFLFTLARGLHTSAQVLRAPMTRRQLAQVRQGTVPRELMSSGRTASN